MQINPVLLDKTKTVDYLTSVLNRIEPMFGVNLSSLCERHGDCLQDVSQEVLAGFSIRELKSLADSLIVWFETSSLPKRNSKISLSRWIAEILLYIQQAIHVPIGGVLPAVLEDSGVEEVLEPDEKRGYVDAASSSIEVHIQSDVEVALFAEPLLEYTPSEVECPECRADELFIAQNNLCNVIRCRACDYAVPKTYLGPIKSFAAIADQVANSPCSSCGFVHGLHENTLCDYPNPSPKVEVLNPEVYTISIINSAGNFSEERVSRLPSYLLDRNGKLLKKFWSRNCDAGYAEIVSEHLSNIAVESGLVIKLMTENLEVSQACIAGDLPPFLIHGGGVYKRDRVKLSLAPRYFQVVSEYLSNIVVV
jgi:hypothetical protein